MANFGFLQSDWYSPYTVLWTFIGRLRLNPEIKEKVDSSHLYIYQTIWWSLLKKMTIWWSFDGDTAQLILDEATEIVKYIQHHPKNSCQVYLIPVVVQ
jgi:hypothetical protein